MRCLRRSLRPSGVRPASVFWGGARRERFRARATGERDGVLSLIERYRTANPDHREGFGKLNNWWWRPLKDDPRYKCIEGVPL